MSMKGWFLAAWLFVLVMQSSQLVVLGTLYIFAVFLYHYREGTMRRVVTMVLWYWVIATVSLFFWVRFQIWVAGWIHVFITWFAPIILTSLMPFNETTTRRGISSE